MAYRTKTRKYCGVAVEGNRLASTVEGAMKQLHGLSHNDRERTSAEFWRDQSLFYTELVTRIRRERLRWSA